MNSCESDCWGAVSACEDETWCWWIASLSRKADGQTIQPHRWFKDAHIDHVHFRVIKSSPQWVSSTLVLRLARWPPPTNQKALHHTDPYSEVSCAQINIDVLWFTRRHSRRNIYGDAQITAIDYPPAEWRRAGGECESSDIWTQLVVTAHALDRWIICSWWWHLDQSSAVEAFSLHFTFILPCHWLLWGSLLFGDVMLSISTRTV